jgi:hypothetical protein
MEWNIYLKWATLPCIHPNEIEWSNMNILEKDYMSFFPKFFFHINEFWNIFSL